MYTPKAKCQEYLLAQLNQESVDVSGGKEYNYKSKEEYKPIFNPIIRAQAANIRKNVKNGE